MTGVSRYTLLPNNMYVLISISWGEGKEVKGGYIILHLLSWMLSRMSESRQ